MLVSSLFTSLALGLAMTGPASAAKLGRAGLSKIVDKILASMVAHDPYTLPLAPTYKATENSHPAALKMMESWRTIVEAGSPSLLALDTHNQTGYFALDVSEGNLSNETVLRGRFAVVDEKITELELFLNRARGDHGFSFSALELPVNYEVLMDPPANRTRATRAELVALSESLFATYSYAVNVSDDCSFTEVGWHVIDPGTWSNGSTTPLGCAWRTDHPTDAAARSALVVDEVLGIVLTSGMIPGRVMPYQNVSAFIPDAMVDAQDLQITYAEEVLALGLDWPQVAPFYASSDTLEVLQLYNSELQAMQINCYLSGPNQTSPWVPF